MPHGPPRNESPRPGSVFASVHFASAHEHHGSTRQNEENVLLRMRQRSRHADVPDHVRTAQVPGSLMGHLLPQSRPAFKHARSTAEPVALREIKS